MQYVSPPVLTLSQYAQRPYSFGFNSAPEQSVTNIFEYSNIRIFSIRIFIRTFVRINFLDTNIFGYSFVSKSYSVRVWRIFEYSNIRIIFNTNIHSYHIRIVSFYTNIFGYSFVSFSWYEYIRIFIRIEINTNVTLWSMNKPRAANGFLKNTDAWKIS